MCPKTHQIVAFIGATTSPKLLLIFFKFFPFLYSLKPYIWKSTTTESKKPIREADKKKFRAIKRGGGAGLGLNDPAIKRRTFFSRLPLLLFLFLLIYSLKLYLIGIYKFTTTENWKHLLITYSTNYYQKYGLFLILFSWHFLD